MAGCCFGSLFELRAGKERDGDSIEAFGTRRACARSAVSA